MDATSVAANELREAFEKARDQGTSREARAAAVAYYRQRVSEGGTQASAASELGISKYTLAKWHQHRASGTASPAEVASTRAPDGEAAALRLEVEALGPKTPSRRFPEDLRTRIVSWAQRRRAAGWETAALERELGVPWTSLSKWMKGKAQRMRTSAPKLRPVAVVEARLPQRPTLRTPGGFVVEGLDVEGMVELLRRLG